MKKIIVIILVFFIVSVGYTISPEIWRFTWNIDFSKKEFEEEGFIAPDLIIKYLNENMVISDPAANGIKLVDKDGKIIKDYSDAENKNWIPLQIISSNDNQCVISTNKFFYFFDESLSLLNKTPNNWFFYSMAIDNNHNIYIYDSTYKKKYSAKVLKINIKGQITEIIDCSPQSSNQPDLLYLKENKTLLLVRNDKYIDISRYTLEGKLINKERYMYRVSGKLIGYHEKKLVFWDPEDFSLFIVDKNSSRKIDLLKILQSKDITIKDILSSSSGPKYCVEYEDLGVLLILVSTKDGVVVFEESV